VSRRRAIAPALALLAALAARADGSLEEPLPAEPPPEIAEGEDYVFEPADSLEDGTVEVGVGASARPGGALQRRRRVRFSGQGMRAGAREGAGDALAGASVDGRLAGGSVSLGRLAPRWGRGLVLGASADPWSRAPDDRGASARFRGRSGEGARYRLGSRRRVELLAGRFARRDLGGLGLAAGPFGVGALAARGRSPQGSLGFEHGPADLELAFDGTGRWRAEGAILRRFEDWRVGLRGRAGLAGFRSLAEPRRAGPARALGAAAAGLAGAWRIAAAGALWRFRPDAAGARASLEVARELAEHGALVVGLEEQHGTRREPPSRAAGFRQGLWSEWRGRREPLGLALRHEVWGERSGLRAAVRAVTAARIEAGSPSGVFARLAHAVYRGRRGETVYLPEAASDRLVLRALSGAGTRTRLECGVRAGGGSLRATLEITAAADKPTRLLWTFDWTRRARTRASLTPPRTASDP
jgi:hypothetical protein